MEMDNAQLQAFIDQRINVLTPDMIKQSFTDRQYSVTPVPYHVHNGVDSPILPETPTEWTYLDQLSWNNVSTTQTFSNLPLHDEYKLVPNLTNRGNTNTMIVNMQLNGVTGATYFTVYLEGNTIHSVATTFIWLINGTVSGPNPNMMQGEILISGKHVDGAKGICGNIVSVAARTSIMRQASLESDSTDLTSITIIPTNAVTGIVEVWYRDNNSS